MEHLNILDDNVRTGHSCEAQLISVVKEIQAVIDCRKQVDLILLDFEKPLILSLTNVC